MKQYDGTVIQVAAPVFSEEIKDLTAPTGEMDIPMVRLS